MVFLSDFVNWGSIRPSSEKMNLTGEMKPTGEKKPTEATVTYSLWLNLTQKNVSLGGGGSVFNTLLRPGHLSEYQSRLWCFSITASEMQE